MLLPQYQVPTAPNQATGSAVPYIGPYAQQQALAQQAYENATAQLAAKRSQTLQQYGYMPTADGSIAVDPSNPFGQYQQTLLGNQTEADNIENSSHARGFMGAGLGHQAENAGKTAEQARLFNMSQALASSLANLSSQGQQAQYDLSNANIADQLASIQYAQQNHLFANGKPMLSQAEVNQRVRQMAKAFAQRFGATGKNKKGETFQQRLNDFQASQLYDPNAHYGIAGVKY